MSKKITAVDIFCGVGGLTYGLSASGIDVKAGFDIDPECHFPYETNNNANFVCKDIRNIEAHEISSIFDESSWSLLAGCAPCQPFSTYSQSKKDTKKDEKWDLVLDFLRITEEIKPDFITMENVPQLEKQAIFQDFLTKLRVHYFVWHSVIDCADYGIPQTRKRLVLIASRWGEVKLEKPKEMKKKTVRQTISNLPPIIAGVRDSSDSLHIACSLSDINLKRIQHSKPGGTWRDWPADLVANCHKKDTGKTYPSVYGRMAWDEPSPTITTQCFGFGNGRFGHPEQDRAISLREAALIQTFPREYCFIKDSEPVRFSVLGRMIGNSVPVRLGEIIGAAIVDHAAKITANQLELFDNA